MHCTALQLYVATAPELAGVSGQYFKPVGVRTASSALGRDRALQRRLWEVSADMTARFLRSKEEEEEEQGGGQGGGLVEEELVAELDKRRAEAEGLI
jgi:hypothetical protein